MFWPRSIHPGHSYQDHDQRIIFEVHVSQRGGRDQKDVSLDKIEKGVFLNLSKFTGCFEN